MTTALAPADLQRELVEARRRLAEAEETLRAIGRGEVDAVVIDGDAGPTVYTLKSAAEPYRLMVEQMQEGAATVTGDGVVVYCNGAFERLIGARPGSVVGTSLAPLVGPADFRVLVAPEGCAGAEIAMTPPDGRSLALFASSTPLVAGDRTLWSIVVADLTRQALRLRYEAIIEASEDAIYALSPDLVIETWNGGAEKLFGYGAAEAIGRSDLDLCSDAGRVALTALAARVRDEGVAVKADIERRRKDGLPVSTIHSLAPVGGAGGSLAGFAAVAHDITERRAAEETQRLLLSELSHRIGNTLAIVQSIANQTLRHSPSPAAFAAAFTGRLQALSRAHDALTAGKWRVAELSRLVREQLLVGGTGDAERVSISGPEVRLGAQTALALALMLHELGTNARKHGALAAPGGRASISWTVEQSPTQPELRLSWREEDGPKVRPPKRRGFGSALIEQSLRSIGGAAEVSFKAAGVHCDMRVPLAVARGDGLGA